MKNYVARGENLEMKSSSLSGNPENSLHYFISVKKRHYPSDDEHIADSYQNMAAKKGKSVRKHKKAKGSIKKAPIIDPHSLEYPESGNKRIKRYVVETCFPPSEMDTAELRCLRYPNYVTCRQKCIFGYKLAEGITREIKCNHSEGKWKPTGFEECKPFVDCGLTLTTPGQMNCTSAVIDKAPVCLVSCLDYEDKKATPLRHYQCNIDGTWDKKLPFCVSTGAGLALVPPPAIKLHTSNSKKAHN